MSDRRDLYRTAQAAAAFSAAKNSTLSRSVTICGVEAMKPTYRFVPGSGEFVVDLNDVSGLRDSVFEFVPDPLICHSSRGA